MIIGAKRKEEVIKFRKWGFFNDGIREKNPVFLRVSKQWSGRWKIWEMIDAVHGTSIAAYRTRKEATRVAEELGKKRHLAVR